MLDAARRIYETWGGGEGQPVWKEIFCLAESESQAPFLQTDASCAQLRASQCTSFARKEVCRSKNVSSEGGDGKEDKGAVQSQQGASQMWHEEGTVGSMLKIKRIIFLNSAVDFPSPGFQSLISHSRFHPRWNKSYTISFTEVLSLWVQS